MPPAFQRQPMDRSAHRGRMVNLMLTRGNAEAAGEQRGGQIAAQTWQSMGALAGGLASDLWSPDATMKRREQASRVDQLDEQDRQRSKTQNLDGLMQMVGDMPPDEAADVLDQEGYRDEAHEVRMRAAQARQAIKQDQIQTWTLAQQHMESAARLIDSVSRLESPEAQAAQYAAILPKVKELVGEDGAKQLGLGETFDPERTANVAEWTMTAAQRLAWRKQTWQEAKLEASTKEERLKTGVPFLARLMADVDTQDEWEANLQLARGMGVPDEAIQVAGTQFTPDAQARLSRFLPKDAQQGEDKFDFNAFMRADPETRRAMLSARSQWEAAGRKPDSPDSPSAARGGRTGLSAESYAVAVRDKATRLAEAEAEYRASDQSPAALSVLETKKRQILDAFEEQVMGGRGAATAPVRPMASHAQSEQFQVPPEVQKSLTRGPGDYKFKDGSVWRMQRDGRVVRVK